MSEIVEVGPISAFQQDGARQLIKCGDRNIAVFYVKEHFYAIDNACYHHGGPLHHGDIEEMGGHPCIVCPWHSYRITLDSGEGLYWGLCMDTKRETSKSKGVKQRTHPVHVRDGVVYVTVDVSGPPIESDTYAHMAIANQEAPSSRPTTHTSNLRGIHSKSSDSGRPSSAVETAVRVVQSHDVPQVKCILKEAVSADGAVSAFHFDKCGGVDLQHQLRPGMWVTLELPISLEDVAGHALRRTNSSGVGGRRSSVNSFSVQSTTALKAPEPAQHKEEAPVPSTHLRRTYSVMSSSHHRHKLKDGWFTIACKNLTHPSVSEETRKRLRLRGEGSKWLHEHGFLGGEDGVGLVRSPQLRVVDSGGRFSLAQERTLIANRQGRVLIVTAGIGITPALGSLREMLNDTFTRTSGPPLHVAHIHVDPKLTAVPFLPELLFYNKDLREAKLGTDPVTYALKIFCTKQRLLSETSESLQYPLVSEALSKHWVGNAQIADELSSLESSGGLCFGRRPTPADAHQFAATTFGSETSKYVVFLCGPDAMMDEWTMGLQSAGVTQNSIIRESFDF